MSPSWIRSREVKVTARNPRGRSYQVLYRRGGRGYRIETAGTFKTQTEARTRRDLIAGWLAQGLDPKGELRKLAVIETAATRTPKEWQADWLTSLHHLSAKSILQYRSGTSTILALLGTTDLHAVTVADCERIVGQLAQSYKPSSIAAYWQAFAQLLEYAAVDPNPANDRRVKLPKLRRTPPTVPTAEHVRVMLAKIRSKYVLPFVLIEQTAIRVETIDLLTWGSIDVAGGKLRVFEKGEKFRWIEIPRWLMRQLELTCPLEDRSSNRRLFTGLNSEGLRNAMARACVLGKIPHYHPHDLRHRRASLWHLGGIPDAVLAERLGHERASFSKDVYVHVMPVEEIPAERLEAIVVEAVA